MGRHNPGIPIPEIPRPFFSLRVRPGHKSQWNNSGENRPAAC